MVGFSHKKEWQCYSVDEPRKHCAKFKKPDSKDQILCDSIYIEYLEQGNP